MTRHPEYYFKFLYMELIRLGICRDEYSIYTRKCLRQQIIYYIQEALKKVADDINPKSKEEFLETNLKKIEKHLILNENNTCTENFINMNESDTSKSILEFEDLKKISDIDETILEKIIEILKNDPRINFVNKITYATFFNHYTFSLSKSKNSEIKNINRLIIGGCIIEYNLEEKFIENFINNYEENFLFMRRLTDFKWVSSPKKSSKKQKAIQKETNITDYRDLIHLYTRKYENMQNEFLNLQKIYTMLPDQDKRKIFILFPLMLYSYKGIIEYIKQHYPSNMIDNTFISISNIPSEVLTEVIEKIFHYRLIAYMDIVQDSELIGSGLINNDEITYQIFEDAFQNCRNMDKKFENDEIDIEEMFDNFFILYKYTYTHFIQMPSATEIFNDILNINENEFWDSLAQNVLYIDL